VKLFCFQSLFEIECFDKIGIAIRPITKKWNENSPIMSLKIDDKIHQIKVSDVLYFPNETEKSRKIEIITEKKFYLKSELSNFKFESELPIFIDAAIALDFETENENLRMYDFQDENSSLHDDFVEFTQQKKIVTGHQFHQVDLPFEGSILVNEGQDVTAETEVGENLFDPPKVYVISLFDKSYLHLNPENVEESVRIKEGEEVKFGQRIAEIGKGSFIEEIQFQHFYLDSPVRGKVEKINFDSGTIIMREIQDYTYKPKTVNVAKKLNVKPKHIMPYMKKALNDFVYAGDLLASKIIDMGDSKHPMLVSAPSTGTIKKIDKSTGIVTIQYDREPYRRSAGVKGKIHSIKKGHSATISYDGFTLNGIIGFGVEAWGSLKYLEKMGEITNCLPDQVVVISSKIDLAFLKKAEKRKVKGVVAASIDNEDLVEFIGEEIGVALTGNESIPFPIIITEGFGDFEMFKDYYKFFQKQNGKFIYMNGHTQIRAGVTRPKMIVM